MSEFFFELLVEEMPPSHQWIAKEYLQEKIKNFLEEKAFSYDRFDLNTTPRRIIINIEGKLKSSTAKETIFGPPVNAGFDEEGNPTQAALGFAKRLGIEVSQLERIEKDKGEYLAYSREIKAPEFKVIFPKALVEFLYSIPFPKIMRWGEFRFSRKVKNILTIMDGEKLEMEAFGLSSNNISQGHRIFSPILTEISSSKEYFSLLKQSHVIAKNEEREKMIKEALSSKIENSTPPSEEFMNYWRDSVEYPNVFKGEFSKAYMELPEEIISTSLEKEMGLYVLRNKEGLSNEFVGVADNPNLDLSLIIEGYKRVAKAKLEDAFYFWKKDRKKSLSELRKGLKDVIYNDILGNYYEKTERLEELSSKIAEMLGVEPEPVRKAARLSKADLISELVGEFPSLQGIAGGLILSYQGEDETVWKPVYEHYRPDSYKHELPSTMGGSILSLADKIDDLLCAFATGYRPSGSGDPLGTRRAALGIIRLITEKQLPVSLEELIELDMGILSQKITLADRLLQDIKDFIVKRFENKLVSEGTDVGIIRAVVSSSEFDLLKIQRKINALKNLKERGLLSTLTQTHKRITNILTGKEAGKLDSSLFSTSQEKELYEILSAVKEEVEGIKEKEDFRQILDGLLWLCPFIDELFNNVMIMDKDEKIRENRISLLHVADEIFKEFADFSLIQEN